MSKKSTLTGKMLSSIFQKNKNKEGAATAVGMTFQKTRKLFQYQNISSQLSRKN